MAAWMMIEDDGDERQTNDEDAIYWCGRKIKGDMIIYNIAEDEWFFQETLEFVRDGNPHLKAENLIGFLGCFDFTETRLCALVLAGTNTVVGYNFFIRPENDHFEEERSLLEDVFLEALDFGIEEDGCYGVPMYSMVVERDTE